MTRKNNLQLPDGEAVRTRAAVVAYDQADQTETLTTSIRPNPPNTIFVKNMAQLLVEFPNVEIPDNTNITIVIDDSFDLTMPIKLGDNSILEILASSTQTTLTYTGTGAMFQVTNPTDVPGLLTISHIILQGDTTNTVFDVQGSIALDCSITSFRFFDDFGETRFPIFIMNFCGGIGINKGLRFKNVTDYIIESFLAQNFAPTGITWLSVLPDTPFLPSVLEANNVKTFGMFAGDSFFFIPNDNLANSRFKIENSFAGALADLYQQGVDIPITSIVDNTSGKIRCTAVGHGISDKRVGTLNGFAVQTQYNKTSVLTVIDVDTFDAENIPFVANDTGNVNTKSLDSADVGVIAADNPTIPDSMFIAEAGLEVFGAEIRSSVLAQDTAEVITSASWAFQKLERFVIGFNNEGQVQNIDDNTREYDVKYSATIEKVGGGTTNIGIILIKNGVVADAGFNAPRTANSGKIQISGSDLIELSENDTLQVGVINYNSASAEIDISQVSLVISRG